MLSPRSLEPSGGADALVPVRGGLGAVAGIRMGGVHAGIKQRKLDLALMVADARCAAAACVTTNDVKAAPLLVSASHLKASGGFARAIVCNSGCANACTGDDGMAAAQETAACVAREIGCSTSEVIVSSTGVIGVPLPMDRVRHGVERVAQRLRGGAARGFEAAEAIMTTDRVPKLSAYAFFDGGRQYVVGGIAKGSGMIAPNLATMLAFIGTDAPVGARALQAALSEVCLDTFNMISVDGDMSTNDAVYALAPPHTDVDYVSPPFVAALRAVCEDLAIGMARDGEGATKLMQVTVAGASSRGQARAMARAIVDSNLVKAALFGEDPNWGRIVSAAGAAKAGFPDGCWRLCVNGVPWVESSSELIDEAEAHRQLAGHEVVLELDLGAGAERATAWGCDLTLDYVHINAHYRT